MATDLATVKDHPATIIDRLREHSTTGFRSFSQAASHLRDFERRESVTFAALDNDALAAVREAYAAFSEHTGEITQDEINALITLRRAVADLLGLED
jgi:hypothetical protein